MVILRWRWGVQANKLARISLHSNRFVSVLNNLKDEELEAGVQAIREKLEGQEVVSFVCKIIFLVGKKGDDSSFSGDKNQ